MGLKFLSIVRWIAGVLILIGATPALAQVELKDGKLTFGEGDVPFGDLLKVTAEASHSNFIYDKAAMDRFKVTVIIPDGVPASEAMLLLKTLVENAKNTFETVGPFRIGVSEDSFGRVGGPIGHLPGQAMPKETDDSASAILLYECRYFDVEALKNVATNLTTQGAKVITFRNMLMLIDVRYALDRVVRVLRSLDISPGQSKIVQWTALNADVKDVADIVQNLFLQGKAGENLVGLERAVVEERTNSLFLVGSEEACETVLSFLPKLDHPIKRTEQMDVIFLQFQQAEELSQTLSTIVNQNASSVRRKKGGKREFGEDLQVKIDPDKQNNALILRGTPRGIEEIKRLVAKLDFFPKQVFVETVILEMSDQDMTNLGISMIGAKAGGMPADSSLAVGTNYGSLSALSVNPTSLMGLAVGAQSEKNETVSNRFGNDLSVPSFGVLLRALTSNNRAKMLANPYLMGADGEEAEVIVGSNVPFVTGSARDSNNNPVLSIQRQDVALTVKLKPEISENGRVKMEVNIEVQELVSMSETLGPTTSKRQMKAITSCEDGNRVVLGGLLRKKELEDVEKVPFLGDIPVFGRLFRSQGTQAENVNLIAVLAPRVIADPEDLKRIFKEKIEERSKFIREIFGEEDEKFVVSEHLADRVGAVEAIRAQIKAQRDAETKRQDEQFFIITPDSVKKVAAPPRVMNVDDPLPEEFDEVPSSDQRQDEDDEGDENTRSQRSDEGVSSDDATEQP